MPYKDPIKRKEYHKEYWKNYYKINKKRDNLMGKIWRQKNPNHYKEYWKTYYKNNLDKVLLTRRKYNLKKEYNITIEQYNEMFKKQNGRCAICNKHQNKFKRKLAVDHNHKTKKNRDLLCISCNLKVGHYEKSDIKGIKKYLNKHKRKELN